MAEMQQFDWLQDWSPATETVFHDQKKNEKDQKKLGIICEQESEMDIE